MPGNIQDQRMQGAIPVMMPGSVMLKIHQIGGKLASRTGRVFSFQGTGDTKDHRF
jgi:hypothetical protein